MKMTTRERRQRRVMRRLRRNKIHNSVLMFLTTLMAGLYISCLCCGATKRTLPLFFVSVIWLFLVCMANRWTWELEGDE